MTGVATPGESVALTGVLGVEGGLALAKSMAAPGVLGRFPTSDTGDVAAPEIPSRRQPPGLCTEAELWGRAPGTPGRHFARVEASG